MDLDHDDTSAYLAFSCNEVVQKSNEKHRRTEKNNLKLKHIEIGVLLILNCQQARQQNIKR